MVPLWRASHRLMTLSKPGRSFDVSCFGSSQGRQQGLREGQASILLWLLELRFGEVPEAVKERVKAADLDEIRLWCERVLTAGSVEEVLG